MIQLIICWVVY